MADASIEDSGELDLEIAPKKGLSGKKLVLFIVLPLLLVIGGGAGAYFLGLLDPLLGKGTHEEAAVEEEAVADSHGKETAASHSGPAFFYDLPDLLVNLNGTGKRTAFLKLSISLELGSEKDSGRLDSLQPRIIDSFQVYLRELRIEDLEGSAGLQRLREELLLRVNGAVSPVKVRDVLFKQMLVQ